jgi:hypothetical protein
MSNLNHSGNEIDLALFEKNRRLIPREALAPYAGQQVAFSADGTRVVAHGPDYDAVLAQLRALGLDSSEVVWDRIPGPDEESWL